MSTLESGNASSTEKFEKTTFYETVQQSEMINPFNREAMDRIDQSIHWMSNLPRYGQTTSIQRTGGAS
jgi:hypothetical protein